jgi:DNA polymerase (family X)
VPSDPENREIAAKLDEFAVLLDLAGANGYSVRAYRRAAELVRGTSAPVAQLVRAGRARELRGIGAAIEARLRELVETGRIVELEELERTVSPALVGLGRFIGLGSRRMLELARALDVATPEEFEAAAREGRIPTAPGFGRKAEEKVLAGLARREEPRAGRALLLPRARNLLAELAEDLGGEMAGDPRRWRDACEELAVVCASHKPAAVLDAFGELPAIVAVVERNDRRAVGVTVEGVPVTLVAAPPERFGTELLRTTGSAPYVAALARLPDGADESTLYEALGIPYCPPELREQPFRGEPPRLLELGDIRGDLHSHSTWSDGKATVLEMGLAARDRGYEYLAICDHTQNVRVVPGVGADDLRRQAEEIAAANEELAPFRILRGVECDILPDGSLDLPDDILAELDWVMASVHAGQRTPREELTKRVLDAIRHPSVSALSHPTGRLINHRPPNAVDLEEVFAVAAETGTAVEVNGLPDRLDLKGEHVRLAIDAGVKIVVSTDAHSPRGLGNIELAVHTARRGWATAADVVNTRPLDRLLG